MTEKHLKKIVQHLRQKTDEMENIRNLFDGDKEITKKMLNIKIDLIDVIGCIRKKYVTIERKKEDVKKELPNINKQ